MPNNRLIIAFFFVLFPQTNHIYFTVTQNRNTNRHRTLNIEHNTYFLKLLNCPYPTLGVYAIFFFFVFIIFRLTRPGFSLYHLIISHGQFTNFMLLHESSPTTYFTLALSQSPSHYFGSVCLLSSQMHLSAYTFTDTLIVSLHSLHFHICLGPGRKLARLLSH